MDHPSTLAPSPPGTPTRWPGPVLAEWLVRRCFTRYRPLLAALDATLDRRLVVTLFRTVLAILRQRDRAQALLLTELGAQLTGPAHAPTGAKRLSRLLHHPDWQAKLLDEELVRQAADLASKEAAAVPEGRALCLLDGSVVEKPESAVAEGLAPVRSSKARRLLRPRPRQGPGYYAGRPAGPKVVPGWHWQAVLVTGWQPPVARRPVAVGAWQFYRHPPSEPRQAWAVAQGQSLQADGLPTETDAEAARAALLPVVAACGADRLLLVWDRGYSGAPWLGEALAAGWHWVVRWKKGNKLRPAEAPSVGQAEARAAEQEADGVVAWKLSGLHRPLGQRQYPNPRQPRQPVTIVVSARPVCLLHHDTPLWLVKARLGKGSKPRRGGREPLRLLTTEPVTTAAQAFRIVEAYLARWGVEQLLRFGKSELGLQSSRVRQAEARAKLWGLVALAYAFLVEVLGDCRSEVVAAILRWAHRTGRQAAQAWRSLYRLHAGVSALWNEHPPPGLHRI